MSETVKLPVIVVSIESRRALEKGSLVIFRPMEALSKMLISVAECHLAWCCHSKFDFGPRKKSPLPEDLPPKPVIVQMTVPLELLVILYNDEVCRADIKKVPTGGLISSSTGLIIRVLTIC